MNGRADHRNTDGHRPTVAMVLAAGLGNRMRPLTDHVPKPMVPVAGRPLIDHVLDRLADVGVTRAVVNVHHRADVLEAHLTARRGPPAIQISDERDALLETGGGLMRAAPLLWPDPRDPRPILIHNSDSIWIEGVGRTLDRLIAAFDPDRMDACLLLAPTVTSLGYGGRGDFAMDARGIVTRRTERQVVPFVFTGVSIAAHRLFEAAPAGAFSLNRLWDRAIERRRVHGIRLDGLWMHVGDPAALAEAECRIAGHG